MAKRKKWPLAHGQQWEMYCVGFHSSFSNLERRRRCFNKFDELRKLLHKKGRCKTTSKDIKGACGELFNLIKKKLRNKKNLKELSFVICVDTVLDYFSGIDAFFSLNITDTFARLCTIDLCIYDKSDDVRKTNLVLTPEIINNPFKLNCFANKIVRILLRSNPRNELYLLDEEEVETLEDEQINRWKTRDDKYKRWRKIPAYFYL